MWIDILVKKINDAISTDSCATDCSMYGLTRLIEKGEKTMPAYLRSGEWLPVVIDDRKGFQVYHRKLDFRQVESDIGEGDDVAYEFTLTMRMFVIGIKPTTCRDSNIDIGAKFQGAIPQYPANFDNLQLLKIVITGINDDFDSVFNDEFPDREVSKYITQAAAISIDYTVTGVICGSPCDVILA